MVELIIALLLELFKIGVVFLLIIVFPIFLLKRKIKNINTKVVYGDNKMREAELGLVSVNMDELE